MKFILLLILAMTLGTSTLAAPRAPHDCCPDEHCSLQCPDMGCAPVGLAIAPPSVSVIQILADAGSVQMREVSVVLPSPDRIIWVPPD